MTIRSETMRTCTVKDCPFKHWACGYCNKHYMQHYRNGKITESIKKPRIALLDYYTNELIDVYDTIEDAAHDNHVSVSGIRHAFKRHNGLMKNKKMKFEFIR